MSERVYERQCESERGEIVSERGESVCGREKVCVRERKRVCVCMCQRERDCVCVCEREREGV